MRQLRARVAPRPTAVVLVLLSVFLGACASGEAAIEPWLPAAADDEQGGEPPASEDNEVLQLPVVTYDVYLARDPFEPVREPVEPEPPTTVTTGPTPAPTPAPGDPIPPTNATPPPGDPTAPEPGTSLPPTAAPTPDDDPDCRDQGEIVCRGTTVSLAEIVWSSDGWVAVVVVNGTEYRVRTGDVFAEYFVVRSIEQGSVWVSYGDESFELTERSRRLK